MATSNRDEYDTELSGDLAQTKKARQTSFDITNTPPKYLSQPSGLQQATQPPPSGPVGRAQQQLATVAPVSLSQVNTAPQQTPVPQQAQQRPSLEQIGSQGSGEWLKQSQNALTQPRAPIGVQPINQVARPSLSSVDPTPAASPNVQPASLSQALPGPISAEQFRPTGAGSSSSQGGQIVARIGSNGVPEFSNDTTAQTQAASLGQISATPQAGFVAPTRLEDLPIVLGAGGQRVDQAENFASLGSAGNIGDGKGTFSQANAGDAALAMGRYERANQLRRQYANEDRLDRANADAYRADHTVVVRDSSKPFTRKELIQQEIGEKGRVARLEDISTAQGQIGASLQNRAGEQQLRQASRLEDLQVAATAPGATEQDRARLSSAIDPTGAKALDRQLTQAQIQKTQADTAKTSAEAAGAGPTGQKAELDRLEIEKRKTEAANASQTLTTQKEGSLEIAKRARDLAQSIGKDKQFDSITGTIDSMAPTFLGESKDLINRANQLQTLLTADNLKLMTGVLTDKDISFLTQIGSGLNVGSMGIDGSEKGTRKVLDEIVGRLDQKISSYEKSNPASGKPTASPAPASPVKISTDEQFAQLPSGTNFFDPQGNLRRKP